MTRHAPGGGGGGLPGTVKAQGRRDRKCVGKRENLGSIVGAKGKMKVEGKKRKRMRREKKLEVITKSKTIGIGNIRMPRGNAKGRSTEKEISKKINLIHRRKNPHFKRKKKNHE